MSRVVYLDGQFVPESEAKLSIYDLSVMQAAAAFEMTRSFNGTPFRLWDHLNRLIDSCLALSIPQPLATVDIHDLCYQLAERNDHGPGEEHRLLIVVSPGCAPIYRHLEGVIDHPFLYIADFPLRYTVQGFAKYFTEGVHCVTSSVQQVPNACVPSSAKHRSRLHFHLAQQQAPPGTWPLMQWYDPGYEASRWAEAPGANIMFVLDGQVRSLEQHALGGISMQTAKELMNGTECTSRSLWLPEADELWLTGTPFCALPVVSLDGQPIGNGQIGPRYKELMAKWNDLVGLDIAQQIIAWDRVCSTV